MNKTAIVLITLLVIAGGIFFYTQSRNNAMMEKDTLTNSEMMESTSEKNADNTMMEDEGAMKGDSMMSQTARYVEYTPEALEQAANTRRVLFFYASWCPTCRPADQSFSQNVTQIPEDVTVIRVNYNDPETDQAEKDLAKKYGVTYQHTYVQIDENGNEVTKWNGGDIDELLTNIK